MPSALQAIRSFCLECQGKSFVGVADCIDTTCHLYAYRFGTALPTGQHKPLKACKDYCHLYCQADTGYSQVQDCRGDMCAVGPCHLFPFRMGKNPNYTQAYRELKSSQMKERITKILLAKENSNGSK